ncbi:TetR family transcriptional regulator [Gordonia terrae]|uniref:TetR/AcrR family transcriptional regulator n=2 Tax=Gordonia terrae TaxID=2055 RepID=A0AAD0KCV3_9ACTN|nr:TetR family transcriptional regulator [Gordonia terrae]VTR08253.1 TetR family transcriptional regulator [Clostridioides difficile]ANY25346.1 TetR family transcriptional regulator [Gordonia terrae]AWO86098.1 TetR/AcrR family transcriptional regulator [Gordonia terrae]VTS62883.1 HTH-type transcriptional repressor KstR2 [Gordonia terrae]GAB42144.1 putative TetR family transcriptional regulator [Gordonia terrae NBRC 100016]
MSATADAREDSPRSRRSQILTVAIEQFGRAGYEHTKWSSVAEQVGIGQTALYHYFESKAHCLMTIIRLELTDSIERFHSGTAGIPDPAGALGSALDSALRGSSSDMLRRRILQNHADILSTPRRSRREEADRVRSQELVAELEQHWADLLERGMDDGHFVRGDPVIVSRLVLGMLGSAWRWYLPGGPLSPNDFARAVSNSAIRMVTA